MATAKTQPNVDLFGNSTLTPRQMVQQQLDALLKDTAARTASLDQRSQGVAKMGAATGGLIGEALIGAGVLPEPPERARARRLQEARDATQKAATEQGIDPVNNPKEFADLAASHFLRAGDEQAALMAIQYRQLHEANERTAAAERAKIANLEADTKKKLADAENGGEGRSPFYKDVDLADGSKASHNARTGEFIDPVTNKPITDPKRLRGAKYDPTLKRDLAEASELGKQTGGAKFDLPTAEANAGIALKAIDDALADPALRKATGAFAGRLPALFGEQARGVARIDQLKGGAFLAAYNSLRGGGHITEIESQKGSEAIARLNRAQTHEDFVAATQDLRSVITTGLASARKKAGVAQGGKHGVLDADGVPAAPGLPSGWKVKVK